MNYLKFNPCGTPEVEKNISDEYKLLSIRDIRFKELEKKVN